MREITLDSKILAMMTIIFLVQIGTAALVSDAVFGSRLSVAVGALVGIGGVMYAGRMVTKDGGFSTRSRTLLAYCVIWLSAELVANFIILSVSG